jgi:hypothetical protein
MADPLRTLARLHAAVAAVAPVLGVSCAAFGDGSAVRVDHDPGGTDAQRQAAADAVAAFDWSDAAQAAWEAQQARGRAQDRPGGAGDVDYAVRALGVALALRLNELYAAYNADRQARGLAPFVPGPLSACPQGPLTKAQGQADVRALVQGGQAEP